MNNSKLALGATIAASIFLIYAIPAAGEFTATAKSTEGKENNFVLLLEGIGATIDCGSPEPGFTWQIMKEGKASEKGPLLKLKFKSWGECTSEYTESKESKEGKVTGGECELETTEPGGEHTALLTVASACRLQAEVGKKETCEIVIEPKGNKELSLARLIDSGEQNENLVASLALEKVAATALGPACVPAGIKSTTTAELKGELEAKQVRPAISSPPLRMSYVIDNQITAVLGKRTVNVTNFAPVLEIPGSRLLEAGNSPWYTVAKETLSTCKRRPLLTNAACPMEVQLNKTTNGAIRWVAFQIWEGGNVVSEVYIYGNA
jgi:hypothetical protein